MGMDLSPGRVTELQGARRSGGRCGRLQLNVFEWDAEERDQWRRIERRISIAAGVNASGVMECG